MVALTLASSLGMWPCTHITYIHMYIIDAVLPEYDLTSSGNFDLTCSLAEKDNIYSSSIQY